jgi:hypothetical protein
MGLGTEDAGAERALENKLRKQGGILVEECLSSRASGSNNGLAKYRLLPAET